MLFAQPRGSYELVQSYLHPPRIQAFDKLRFEPTTTDVILDRISVSSFPFVDCKDTSTLKSNNNRENSSIKLLNNTRSFMKFTHLLYLVSTYYSYRYSCFGWTVDRTQNVIQKTTHVQDFFYIYKTVPNLMKNLQKISNALGLKDINTALQNIDFQNHNKVV